MFWKSQWFTKIISTTEHTLPKNELATTVGRVQIENEYKHCLTDRWILKVSHLVLGIILLSAYQVIIPDFSPSYLLSEIFKSHSRNLILETYIFNISLEIYL